MTDGSGAMAVIHEWWTQIVALVAIVAFGVNLKRDTQRNARDIKDLEERINRQRAEDLGLIRSDIGEVKKGMDTIQGDIKALLKKG